MRSITAGVCLSLFGSAALAQTSSPAQPPKPPVPQAVSPQSPAPQAPEQAAGGTGPGISGSANNGPQVRKVPGGPSVTMTTPGAGQSGPPEGEIIETPNGFYLVRPGQPGVASDQPGTQPGPIDDGAAANGGAMADEDTPPPPPRRRPRPQGPMPEGKGARLRVHAPNLDIDVKCPDDESMKVCVDSVSQLLDKAAAQSHP